MIINGGVNMDFLHFCNGDKKTYYVINTETKRIYHIPESQQKVFEVMDLGRRIYSDDFQKFDNDGYIFVSDPEKLKR